tara:strand:- start:12240 stop:12590 length:351 start_codon:yes stop_codon:yes gene_type:complete
MDDYYKRILLFLIGCIGVRFSLVFIAKNINIDYLPFMGYLALLPAIGFSYIYLNDLRKTGPEVFGDRIWWNFLRPIHAILYFMFAYNAINSNPKSWLYLFIDVLIGLNSFLIYHML